jgi:hypothetical protein
LLYQRLFEYSGTVQDIIELPYSIYNDVILKQIALKKKEKEELENIKNKDQNRSRSQQSPFKRRK